MASQFQQALKVAMLNKDRNETVYKKVRDLYRDLKLKRGEIAKLETAKSSELDDKKQAFQTWHAGMKSQVTDLVAEARKIEDQIYIENQPKPHSYELTKL